MSYTPKLADLKFDLKRVVELFSDPLAKSGENPLFPKSPRNNVLLAGGPGKAVGATDIHAAAASRQQVYGAEGAKQLKIGSRLPNGQTLAAGELKGFNFSAEAQQNMVIVLLTLALRDAAVQGVVKPGETNFDLKLFEHCANLANAMGEETLNKSITDAIAFITAANENAENGTAFKSEKGGLMAETQVVLSKLGLQNIPCPVAPGSEGALEVGKVVSAESMKLIRNLHLMQAEMQNIQRELGYVQETDAEIQIAANVNATTRALAASSAELKASVEDICKGFDEQRNEILTNLGSEDEESLAARGMHDGQLGAVDADAIAEYLAQVEDLLSMIEKGQHVSRKLGKKEEHKEVKDDADVKGEADVAASDSKVKADSKAKGDKAIPEKKADVDDEDLVAKQPARPHVRLTLREAARIAEGARYQVQEQLDPDPEFKVRLEADKAIAQSKHDAAQAVVFAKMAKSEHKAFAGRCTQANLVQFTQAGSLKNQAVQAEKDAKAQADTLASHNAGTPYGKIDELTGPFYNYVSKREQFETCFRAGLDGDAKKHADDAQRNLQTCVAKRDPKALAEVSNDLAKRLTEVKANHDKARGRTNAIRALMGASQAAAANGKYKVEQPKNVKPALTFKHKAGAYRARTAPAGVPVTHNEVNTAVKAVKSKNHQ